MIIKPGTIAPVSTNIKIIQAQIASCFISFSANR